VTLSGGFYAMFFGPKNTKPDKIGQQNGGFLQNRG